MNVEHELRRLVEFPPEPDLRGPVLARLPRRRVSLRLAFALVVLAAVGALFAIPQTRAAILDFFRIGDVEIRRVETQPRAPTGVVLGERVSLEEAREAVEIELAVPARSLAVYLDRPFVTIEVERGVYLTQWGGTGPTLLRKEAGPGTRFEEVVLEGTLGLWIEGAEHVVVRGPLRRTAGNVLVWERDFVTYRLEGSPDLRHALAIVRNLSRR